MDNRNNNRPENGENGQEQRPPQRRGPMIRMGPGGGPPGMPGEKPKDFKGSLVRLVRYLGRYRFAILGVMIAAIAATVISLLGPKVLGWATDELAEGIQAAARGTGGINFDRIGQILLQLGVLYVAAALLSYIQGWIMSGVTNKVAVRLRKDISEKFHRLPLKYYESTTQGEILSRVTNDVDTLNSSMSQSLTEIITSVTTIIGVLIMMLTYSGSMTLVSLIVVPMSAIFVRLIAKRSQKYFANQQKYLGEVNGITEETYGGQTVVRAFNNESKRIEDFREKNEKLYDTSRRAQFLSGMIQPAVMFIGNLSYVITCTLGAYYAGRGIMSIGDIQAFINYVRRFNQPISNIANISNVLQQAAAAAERVFEFLEEPEEVPEDANPVTVVEEKGSLFLVYTENGESHKRPFCGNIEFVDVCFGYDPDKEVIHHFSAFVPAGQKVAIVGHTGAGKTTIVKLLMRFYDVGQGQILIDGLDIRRFTRSSLRSLFGMVLQDTWLYNDTIAENIRYGKRSAGREEIVEAARAARVDHFVRTLPGGYEMEIDEESTNISAGQKQLMTIARAILADPQVLILDEATSSVDTKTEVDIQRAMDILMQNRTSFVIAHRLSTIRNCGLILMMENGDIIEQGDHNQLLAKNGRYADLYNAQFESA